MVSCRVSRYGYWEDTDIWLWKLVDEISVLGTREYVSSSKNLLLRVDIRGSDYRPETDSPLHAIDPSRQFHFEDFVEKPEWWSHEKDSLSVVARQLLIILKRRSCITEADSSVHPTRDVSSSPWTSNLYVRKRTLRRMRKKSTVTSDEKRGEARSTEDSSSELKIPKKYYLKEYQTLKIRQNLVTNDHECWSVVSDPTLMQRSSNWTSKNLVL